MYAYIEDMENVAPKPPEREEININQANKNGDTALSYAIKNKMESVIKRIKELKKK